MANKNVLLLGAGVFALLAVSLSAFTVSETEKAILLEFKKIVRTDFEPGFQVKLPWQQVKKFDDRILTLESKPERFLTSEKKNVIVDWFVKWRINDVAKFYTSVAGDKAQANIRLDQITKDALRSEFSKRTIRELVSSERDQLRDVLTKLVNPAVEGLGIEVVDIRVMGVDLPEEVSSSVYRRMVAERDRVAREFRSRGAEAAERIRAEADREREVLLASAYKDAETRRGEGDAKASEIYAEAYGKNREFFQFNRSLMAYRQAFKNDNDMIVLEPDSEFFQYFKKLK
ncbi:protease FtsH subunit HflC [Methylomagnum ishizawai]|uniref:Protein HflC n=1 Tax=Methylomagnum ishizawai TaxID=1760988 RepID=A0A1Y6CZW5_9GAMM|nr:protease modulator HflC [Methylomagnum ishizawai]SMF96228.1 protease FtsH subunit HflC [Methylomagnum ishizawai]